jgi:Major tropism determinant N-terminal domain
MANRIQLRRDTAENWTSVNPILADGEPGLEWDTNKIKYGDGTTAWTSLGYADSTFTDFEVDGNLYFKAPEDNSDPMYITRADQTNNLSVMEIYIGDDGGDNINGYYPEDGTYDYLAIKSTNAGLHHLFGSDGTYRNAGGIYFGDNTLQTTAFTGGDFYSNAAVATYLANYDGGINFTSSPAIISGVGTVSTINLNANIAAVGTVENTTTTIGTQITGIESWDGAGADNGYVWLNNQTNFMRLYNLGSSIIGWSFYSEGNPGSVVTITDNAPPLGGPGLRFDGPIGSAPYVVQSPDYSLVQNPLTVTVETKNWVFNTDGSLTLPTTSANVSIDASTNIVSLNTNDTITFSGFSGEILVNDLYDGYVYKYLVGSGTVWLMGSTNTNWTPANTAPSNSVTVTDYTSIEFGPGGYIFTNLAAERSYSFYAVKTRNGA